MTVPRPDSVLENLTGEEWLFQPTDTHTLAHTLVCALAHTHTHMHTHTHTHTHRPICMEARAWRLSDAFCDVRNSSSITPYQSRLKPCGNKHSSDTHTHTHTPTHTHTHTCAHTDTHTQVHSHRHNKTHAHAHHLFPPITANQREDSGSQR